MSSSSEELIIERANLFLKLFTEKEGNTEFVPKRPKLGESWFLLNYVWWSHLKGDGRFICKDPGPLDNSCLMEGESQLKLKSRLVRGFDYEIVPEAVWMLIKSWYTVRGPEILRYANSKGEIEVYPLVFKIRYQTEEEVEVEFGMDTKVKVLSQTLFDRFQVKDMGLEHAKKNYASHSDFTPVNLDLLANSTIHECGWTSGDLIRIITKINHSSFSPTSEIQGSKSLLLNNVGAATTTYLGNAGDRLGDGRKNGLCGLNNLGNTCYLNTVLQCLSHTGPLRALFLSGQATKRVNMASKFGRNGDVVKEISNVFAELWSGKHKALSPAGFKQSLDKWTTMFRGRNQQDAHEALAFILDGIHEDTNFGLAKTRPSVSEEVFFGSFQSKLSCPVCSTESVNTEPFQIVSLELTNTPKQLPFIPLDGDTKLISIVPGDGTVEDLIQKVTLKCKTQVAIARVRKDLSSTTEDLRNFEVLGPKARYELIPPIWQIVVFEIECSLTEAEIIHCVHRKDGKILGFPFGVSVKKPATKKDLLDKLRNRFGQDFVLRQNLKSRKISELGTEVTSNSPTTSDISAFVYILDWTTENVSIPTLPLMHGPTIETLEDRISTFCAPEILADDNLWSCPKCAEKRAARKQISFTELPEVLIIHLKRFTSQGAKLSNVVSYSLELTIDKEKYELYAYIRHHGATISGGHYDTIIQAVDKTWHHFNDSSVTPLPLKTLGKISLSVPSLADPSAYMFFYRKQKRNSSL